MHRSDQKGTEAKTSHFWLPWFGVISGILLKEKFSHLACFPVTITLFWISLFLFFTQSQLNLRGRGSFHPSISFLYSQPHLFLISNFQAGLVIYFPTFQSPLPELSLRFSFLSTSFDASLFHSMLNSGSFRANLIYPSICRSGSLDLPSTHFLCFT